MKIAVTSVVLWLACATAPITLAAEKVGLIKIDGAIGPATASYISRSIEEARDQNAQCLIIQLNTPGGLLDSTQKIVQSFLGSPVPVVVYVAPTGATATSAGCFITLAANVAAMAPATTIGAAHLPGAQEVVTVVVFTVIAASTVAIPVIGYLTPVEYEANLNQQAAHAA